LLADALFFYLKDKYVSIPFSGSIFVTILFPVQKLAAPAIWPTETERHNLQTPVAHFLPNHAIILSPLFPPGGN
jgi:hypothetical protein